MEPMKRMGAISGPAVLALALLAGCGSSSSESVPVAAAGTASTAPSSSSSLPPLTSSPSVAASTPSVTDVPEPPVPSDTASPTAAVPRPGVTRSASAAAAPQAAAYAAKLCTSLTPLVAFKQQNEQPNLAGVTNGAQAKDLAVRLLTGGIAKAQDEFLNQAKAVDPNNPMALFALAGQVKAQVGTTQSAGVSALRTSTGPEMAAVLHNTAQCAPLLL